MNALSRLAMPLLGKELLELAAQRRTYVIRALYAVLLYVIAGAMVSSKWRYVFQNPVGSYGLGYRLFEDLLILQFCGLYLFVPALMADAIAAEKERGSLALVLMTELSPWSLLVQKYVARLIPVFSLMLLSLPLMGVAYALGGVQSTRVLEAACLLFVTGLQAGALTLACSAYCATVVGAMMASYVVSALVFVGLPLVGVLLREEVWLALLGPYYYADNKAVAGIMPLVGSTAVFLAAARFFLVRRAFVPGRNPLSKWFRQLDAVFTQWNRFFGDRRVELRDPTSVETDPVAWRETCKRALSSPHHLVRLIALVEIPVLWFGAWAMMHSNEDVLHVMAGTVWVLAALTLGVQGSNLIASERTGQTLDVLLTTTLSGEEIVRQKTLLLRRLRWVFIVPLATLALMRWCMDDLTFPDLVVAGFSFCLYPVLVGWLGVWAGLRCQSKGRAALVVLVLLAAWSGLPVLVGFLIRVFARGSQIVGDMAIEPPLHWIGGMVAFQSPAMPVIFRAASWRDAEYCGAALGFLVAGVGLYILRRRCLLHADQLLRRG